MTDDKEVKQEQEWKWWHWMFFWQMVGTGHSSASQTAAPTVQQDTTPITVDAPSVDYSSGSSGVDSGSSGNY